MADTVYSSLQISLEPSSREIRLLMISPSRDPEAKISCSLQKANLEHNPSYIALSYVWGSPEHQRDIQLNGTNFSVTKNLHDALMRNRDATQTMFFWVDALCIDQSSLEERAAQVSIMGDIYRQAKGVCAWLGDATNEEDEPLLGLDVGELLEVAAKLETWSDESFPELRQLLSPSVAKALTSVAQSSYWSRTWIVQEAVLAKKLLLLWGRAALGSEIFLLGDLLGAAVLNSPFLSSRIVQRNQYILEILQSWKDCLNKALAGNTFASCLEPLLGPNTPFPDALPLGIEHVAIPAFDASLNVAQKQLFSTSSGLYGLGPQGLKEGDNVCVLFGSKAPLLLRKIEDHFILVGECFVLGMMNGEVAEKVKNGATVTTFEIR
ncbi:HET-domain-containing protein [Stipitochalara longipes BDJ]|nr:HET-domain-containing protein [Stipitochalara longipes BDJ]